MLPNATVSFNSGAFVCLANNKDDDNCGDSDIDDNCRCSGGDDDGCGGGGGGGGSFCSNFV